MTVETILAVMLALPVYVGDRDLKPENRSELYRPVAEAIAEVSKGSSTMAAALITLGYSESRFARYVLEGRCADGPKGQRCDWDYRKRQPRARGPWQVWAWCRGAWSHGEASPEALIGGARCAARALVAARKRCEGRHPGGVWAGMYSGYRGPTCTWAPAAGRAKRMALLEYQLLASARGAPEQG